LRLPKPVLPAALLASASLVGAAPRQMAVTVDDLPVAMSRMHSAEERLRITETLVETFVRHDVPAIGFVNEIKMGDPEEPRQLDLLERWLDAGLELGNHGYQHLDLHEVDPGEWERDVLLGERVLRPLLESRGRELRFFRHPFLHTGPSLDVRDRTVAFLEGHGYRVAPVTIDNQEWMFGGAYARAGAEEERKRIAGAYLAYMRAIVEYYEEQSDAIAGEPIPHVLLIHAYALNADHLGTLLTWLEERGYGFVSLEQALEHPIYASEDRYAGPSGITWLHRWAITRGVDPAVFAGEPPVPEWIAEAGP